MNVNTHAIRQIEQDFVEAEGPFSDKEELLPERAAMEQVSNEDMVNFLSYGVSLDYNRSAGQLWDNCLELYEVDDGYGTNYFDPEDVVKLELEELRAVFKSIGFRYGNRDARGWMKNSQILVDEFNGSWAYLIEEAKVLDGAPSIVELLNEHNFMFIKGKKLAPFYAKVVHENITSMKNIWELDIPVDVHIRRLTHKLASDDSLSDDEIRNLWQDLGRRENIEPMVVDGGLWIIGNQWDDWGDDYWEQVTSGETVSS